MLGEIAGQDGKGVPEARETGPKTVPAEVKDGAEGI